MEHTIYFVLRIDNSQIINEYMCIFLAFKEVKKRIATKGNCIFTLIFWGA